MGNTTGTPAGLMFEAPAPDRALNSVHLPNLVLQTQRRQLQNPRPILVRRRYYTARDRDQAINMLNFDTTASYRDVARFIGPRCSTSTIFRWRQEYVREKLRKHKCRSRIRMRNP